MAWLNYEIQVSWIPGLYIFGWYMCIMLWYPQLVNLIWTASSEFGAYRLCEQRRFRRACASVQSRQNLRYSLIRAVSQEEPSVRKPDPWPLWMAGHAQLKFVMTECSKTQIRLKGLVYWICLCWTNLYASILLNNSNLASDGLLANDLPSKLLCLSPNWYSVNEIPVCKIFIYILDSHQLLPYKYN